MELDFDVRKSLAPRKSVENNENLKKKSDFLAKKCFQRQKNQNLQNQQQQQQFGQLPGTEGLNGNGMGFANPGPPPAPSGSGIIILTIFQYCVSRCRKFEMCVLRCLKFQISVLKFALEMCVLKL